jgi:hypothetical protein
MPASSAHCIIATGLYRVPKPFLAFAVRSEEPRLAAHARATYGQMHVVRTWFLDAGSLARLAAEGLSRVRMEAFPDIAHANTTLQDLAAAAPGVTDLVGQIAAALRLTGVLGNDPASYRSSICARVDYLACCGAGFHNDVGGHWPQCLFWILALAAADVEFVVPHAAVRQLLAPGDLIVFDPAMAHGLCRPVDDGQAMASSFETGDHRHQVFLTGELLLSDAQWAAVGAPWMPVEEHERRGALDLMVAEFDDRSGAIKRPDSLRGCMQRSSCQVDEVSAGG